ncbi:protease complex subunit PrcB family protein [Polaribacter pectinis]|uniref:Protease complex subunit PrcB family protein n=1 Tax=Polaribacter pectinis TaxID=2738844 RepID=A0A7G9LEC4_9FLAO|nr:protease complex subunit PrcB family protein [Polaribacter pectinis]QNM86973.1 protease complex subunit PrcB family protein [Polaribacter pectinis]
MKTFITIIFTLLLVGCPNNGEGGFTPISKGNLFGAGEEGFKKENIIISSKEDWKVFLTKVDKTNKVSKTFENAIDFNKEKVIVVIDKVRNTGGFSVEVTDVVNEEDQTIIKVKTTGPKPTDMVVTAIMQSYHIIKIKKTNKKIKFLEL